MPHLEVDPVAYLPDDRRPSARDKLGDWPFLLAEGARLLLAKYRPGRASYPRHAGAAHEICHAVIADRWNGRHFEAGAPHFPQFWVRDVGWCAGGLVNHGFRDQLHASLAWALGRFRQAGRTTTTILSGGRAVDIYDHAVDTLPFLLHSLATAGATDLVQAHEDFLAAEVQRCVGLAFDPALPGVRPGRFFSRVKDVTRFHSTCYDHVMLAWLARLLDGSFPQLPNPLHGVPLVEALIDRFWTGTYFRNDAEAPGRSLLSGDANTWPFWIGVVEDGAMLASALAALAEAGLASPFPLKYHARPDRSRVMLPARVFIPNYQGDSIWTVTGAIYIDLLRRVDGPAARRHLETYVRWIERYGTFVEVFEPDGSRPLGGRFGWGAAGGMLWGALFLDVLDRLPLPAAAGRE